MEMKDLTASFDAKDVADNKVMAILAYIGILFLVPLLAAKESKFARFHAKQGLVLFLVEIGLSVIGKIPLVGTIIAAIGGIATFVLAILGIINAAKGQAKELPFIGSIRILK